MKKWKKPIQLIFKVFIVLFLVGSISVLSAEASSNQGKNTPTKLTLNYKKKNVSVGDVVTAGYKKDRKTGQGKVTFTVNTQ